MQCEGKNPVFRSARGAFDVLWLSSDLCFNRLCLSPQLLGFDLCIAPPQLRSRSPPGSPYRRHDTRGGGPPRRGWAGPGGGRGRGGRHRDESPGWGPRGGGGGRSFHGARRHDASPPGRRSRDSPVDDRDYDGWRRQAGVGEQAPARAAPEDGAGRDHAPSPQPGVLEDVKDAVVGEVEPPKLSSYASRILSTDSSAHGVLLDNSMDQLLFKYLPGAGLQDDDATLKSGALLVSQTQAAEGIGKDIKVGEGVWLARQLTKVEYVNQPKKHRIVAKVHAQICAAGVSNRLFSRRRKKSVISGDTPPSSYG